MFLIVWGERAAPVCCRRRPVVQCEGQCVVQWGAFAAFGPRELNITGAQQKLDDDTKHQSKYTTDGLETTEIHPLECVAQIMNQ